MINVIN